MIRSAVICSYTSTSEVTSAKYFSGTGQVSASGIKGLKKVRSNKRLEEGSFESIGHSSKTTSLEIDMTTLSLILEGIDLSNAKQRKRYKRSVYA
jgi:hypothetical protein